MDGRELMYGRKQEIRKSHAYELEIHKIDVYELKIHESHAYELMDAGKLNIHKGHGYELEIHKRPCDSLSRKQVAKEFPVSMCGRTMELRSLPTTKEIA